MDKRHDRFRPILQQILSSRHNRFHAVCFGVIIVRIHASRRSDALRSTLSAQAIAATSVRSMTYLLNRTVSLIQAL